MDYPQGYFDVIILGGGGAGMMCGMQAGQRGRKVLIIDHAKKLGGKILISGGGRCNFTNTGASARQYVSKNSHFAKSALSRFTPDQFIELVRNHRIPFHEKKLGQLFCDRTAQDIVTLLKKECEDANVQFLLDCKIQSVSIQNQEEDLQLNLNNGIKLNPQNSSSDKLFEIQTLRGNFTCKSLVVATGGLSIPKIGATGIGYQLARQFGLDCIETAPALDGFTLPQEGPHSFQGLAGLSVDCSVSCKEITFRENILFTHTGLSGPAALQVSLHWKKNDPIWVNFLPDRNCHSDLIALKQEGSRALVKNILSEWLPARLAQQLCELGISTEEPLFRISNQEIQSFCEKLHHWEIRPTGTVGYSKAEVTRGGVSTAELSSKTMEAKKCPNLYFIGEVIDVTGWLGGYNFQWAWSSGWAAGQAV
jgi:hypothetical protein